MTINDVVTRARHQPVAVRRFGLTPIQLGMLFEGPMQGRPSVNLQQIVLRMPGETLDLDVFEEAWICVQARHEALRTSYAWIGLDEPEQVVWSETAVRVAHTDWNGHTEAEVETLLTGWMAANAEVGYDVTAYPELKIDVFDVGSPERGESTIVVWTNHHLHIDGRSMRLVMEELFDVHERLLSGRSVELGLAPRFSDHAAAVARQDLVGAEAYVRRTFAGYTEPIQLGLPAPTDPGTVPKAAEATRVLPAEVMERLEARAKAAGGTTGAALMVVWAVLLGRYSRRDDVVFGSTRAGRHTTPEAGDMVGCLINTVPLRADVRPSVTVDELMQQLRDQQVAIRPYEHMPLVEVQQWSDVPNGTPLFQTDVVFEWYRLEDQLRALGGNWVNRSVKGFGDVELGLMFRGFIRSGLELHIDYDECRYDAAVMDRMADHVARLLTDFADSAPGTTLGELKMMDDEERTAIVDGLNPSPVRIEQTLPDVFEAAVAAHPDAPAVKQLGASSSISYRELDERANRWAHHLGRYGLEPDQRVALFLPRSVTYVECVLGVVKAGAAWVPMDPSYPAESLAHMLVDSEATVVLTTRELLPRLPGGSAAVIVVDDPAVIGELATSPTTPPDRSALRHDHLAYVIYTSGSTGKPKGVLIEHGSLVGYLQSVTELYGLTSSDRLFQFSALSFDTSIEEVFGTLVNGALLVLRDDEITSSGDAFLTAVEREGITLIGTPTAYWHLLVQHLEETGASVPACVRGVIVGGEKASRRALDSWRRAAPTTTFFNGYGPTEITIASTFFRLEPGVELEEGREVPIGRPAPCSRNYVLDQYGQPMPIGVAGELWVGGPCVGRGYLNQGELTLDRFRPDHVSGQPGARMYRTGDLARWCPDGNIEYLGRVDRQVKLRGYRIEPGEIETVLERHPDVARAVVAVHGCDGAERLVAWVLPSPGARPDPVDLREFTRDLLPSQMVPATVVVVDHLPETPGGKIDLRALPTPEIRATTTTASTALLDETGVAVQQCFADVLKVATVGADDSFFDLGGHSLMAMKLIERIDRAVGRRITLGELHQAPTPRDLAALLQGDSDGPAYEHLLPIQPSGTKPPLFGVHVLGPNAGWYRPLSARLGADQPVMGLWIANPDVDSPADLRVIATRYADEIERWCPSGPVGLAGISLGGYVAYELAQQLRARGREISVLAMFDTAGPDGRPQLVGRERLGRHLQHLRADGLEYVRGRVHGKLWKLGEKVRAVRAKQRQERGGEIPADMWMSRFIELNQAAAREYQVLPYDGPMTVFHATKVSFDRPEVIDAGLGWGPYARGGVEVIDVPGDHMSILAEPHVAVMARHLADVIDRAGRRPN